MWFCRMVWDDGQVIPNLYMVLEMFWFHVVCFAKSTTPFLVWILHSICAFSWVWWPGGPFSHRTKFYGGASMLPAFHSSHCSVTRAYSLLFAGTAKTAAYQCPCSGVINQTVKVLTHCAADRHFLGIKPLLRSGLRFPLSCFVTSSENDPDMLIINNGHAKHIQDICNLSSNAVSWLQFYFQQIHIVLYI